MLAPSMNVNDSKLNLTDGSVESPIECSSVLTNNDRHVFSLKNYYESWIMTENRKNFLNHT